VTRSVNQTQVTRDIRRRVTNCIVVVEIAASQVDAKNDQATAFYQRYGFRPIAGKPRILFLPLATAQKTLSGTRAQ